MSAPPRGGGGAVGSARKKKGRERTGAGIGRKVWPSTQGTERTGAGYDEFEDMLEVTGDHAGEDNGYCTIYYF